jgi:hypothetical protein
MEQAVAAKPRTRVARRWSALSYGAFYVLFLLPFATLYAACSGERIETVNGYQTLAPHSYTYSAVDGTTKTVTSGTDGFAWIVIALLAVAIGLSLIGMRTLLLAIDSVLAIVALFLANLAAGGGKASSKAEIGFWLCAAVVAAAPAADVRPWRRAILVGAVTAAAAAALVAVLIGIIALAAQGPR